MTAAPTPRDERIAWESLGQHEAPSWYLHPLVAAQKRNAHLRLIRHWTGRRLFHSLLKTDLFEEAAGDDHLLPALLAPGCACFAIDGAHSTSARAARRHPAISPGIAVMDVRALAFRPSSFDLVVSTSTLDHFSSREDYLSALRQLAATLRPGGLLILTLDNPLNPLFHPLRWYSRRSTAPFFLGYTPTPAMLLQDVRAAGLAVHHRDWLLHNPRGLSTVLFLALTRFLGSRADSLIAVLLDAFALLGRLPTRRFTACFQAVVAEKLTGSPG